MNVFQRIPHLYRQIIFILFCILCLTPFIDTALGLILGLIIAQTIGHPFSDLNHKATQWLLKISVVGLGFGMNLHHAIEVGQEGLLFTAFSIAVTLLVGIFIGKRLGVDQKTSFLIASGTAICGGSAIAAVSPLIKANGREISMALGAIFILNSIALFTFPLIGHLLQLDQNQFGLFSAIAIHDTSSVVGAAAKYGQEALQTATTVKLERALWIIPLSLVTTILTKGERRKVKIPYFIVFFILAMCISTFLPEYSFVYSGITSISKQGLALTLFLIGAGLNFKTVKSVGPKPLLQAVLLWLVIGGLALGMIYTFFS
ncbi:YeiH family protein [Xanthovirga aplysinae]|uniref:YeiH family protein n=1 Tax=Xanthovirga aplysinae TaxID=2529853 RepID=UPI0012BB6E0C|nr:putative sulfate exporter family transporter [Xanthovirga aplysinae]MTI32531.1 putative sulfate exporter family transporter [Xanthovirga aplysinae]